MAGFGPGQFRLGLCRWGGIWFSYTSFVYFLYTHTHTHKKKKINK